MLLVFFGGILAGTWDGKIFAEAKEIVVGEGQGGWTIGVKYDPIVAAVNDTLVRRIVTHYINIQTCLRPVSHFHP